MAATGILAAMANQQNQQDHPNKGLDTRVYMVAGSAAILIIIASLFFFVAGRGPKSIPKANPPRPNSHLQLPGTPSGHPALA